MITVVYSYKGGVGTSVVAASLALQSAKAEVSTLLVDMLGDQPGILAVGNPPQGYGDWANHHYQDPPPFYKLVKNITAYLDLLGRGEKYKFDPDVTTRGLATLSQYTGEWDFYRNIIIDAGTQDPGWWGKLDYHAVMVVRPCYLNIRKIDWISPETKIVMVSDFGRGALTQRGVEVSIGHHISVVIPHTPEISRMVDAGLLPARSPQDLRPLYKLLED